MAKKEAGRMKKAYIYPWCKYGFSQEIGYFKAKSKHKNVSSQVVCPRCGNFIPTYTKEGGK